MPDVAFDMLVAPGSLAAAQAVVGARTNLSIIVTAFR
jgi:hypothetical protein